MFTWTNKASLLALILGLAGCQMDTGALALPGQSRAVSVVGGAMTVAAPFGYCIDKASTRQQDDGAVVLIGRCSSTSQSPPAVISVTTGVAGSAGVMADGGEALSAHFASPDGRTALSRTGKAGSVRILRTARLDGAIALHIAESGAGDYWRGVFGVSGRLVTISVQGPEGAPLNPATGQRLLAAAITAMREANPTL